MATTSNIYNTGTCVIVNIGSYSVKVGTAGDDFPTAVFPVTESVDVPRSQYKANRKNPFGTIWDRYEDILRLCCRKLQITEDQGLFLVTHQLLSAEHRSKLTELVFERFRFPSLCIGREGILALHASGRTTGITVDIGHLGTLVTPVYDSLPVTLRSLSADYGGNKINMILKNKCAFIQELNWETMAAFKRIPGTCVVSQNFQKDLMWSRSDNLYTEYILPDGNAVKMLNENRFMAAECLFSPTMFGMESPGLHELIHNVGMQVAWDFRDELFRNVCLVGGSGQIEGTATRLYDSLKEWGIENNIVQNATHNGCSAWIGGSMSASLASFESTCLFKHEFEENGAAIAIKKFTI